MKTKTYEVYGLHAGDGVIRYVGLTTTGHKNRLTLHRHVSKKGERDYPVYRWMRKHGEYTVESILLEECSSLEEVGEREVYWIDFHSTHTSNEGGLNVAPGGHGYYGTDARTGSTHTVESIDKRTGQKRTADQVERLRQGQLGKKLSEETKAKISSSHQGKSATDETKVKMSEAQRTNWSSNTERVAALKQRMSTPEAAEQLNQVRAKANHTRWHANRNIIKEGCAYCEQPNN